jgi:hypothetical protein
VAVSVIPNFLILVSFGTANRQLLAEGTTFEREPLSLLELTIHNVSRVENLSASAMLACIERLVPSGSVIVTDYPETYLLSRLSAPSLTEPVRFVLGVAAAAKTMQPAFYQSLPGTLLEGLGRLLATNVKLYVAPMTGRPSAPHWEIWRIEVAVEGSGSGPVTLDDLSPLRPIFICSNISAPPAHCCPGLDA